MRAYLAACVVGVFAYNEKGKLVAHKLFKKDPGYIAKSLDRVQKWALPEETELIKTLTKKGYKEFAWSKELKVKGAKTIQVKENPGQEALNRDLRKLALELKFVKDQAELNQLLTQVQVARTKAKLREVGRDKILMRVVGVTDELDKELNNLSERLREWYGLYFPEAAKYIKSNEAFARAVSQGRREAIEELKEFTEKSAGMEFTEQDISSASEFAKQITSLFKLKEDMSSYLEAASKEVIPNTSALAGPVLACRLLALAGGLDKLAKLPASTLQILGGEKALFRHLKEGTPPPKYGVLFSHPYIQQAPQNLRGKVARLLAASLTLAARIDYFSKEDRSQKLKEELDKKIKKFLKL